jgi:hypothetical protein
MNRTNTPAGDKKDTAKDSSASRSTLEGGEMKRLLVLAAALAAAACVSIGVAASASKQRTGILHLTKECSQYTGEPGSFCTVTSSNLKAIPVGTRDVGVGAVGTDGAVDFDVHFETRGANAAFGHATICGPCEVGTVTFNGGTGEFKSFHADLVLYCPIGGIAHDGRVDDCRLDGPYSFGD